MLLLLPLALADVVNPEPENCPSGSFGTSSHSGEWCAPSTCSSDGECEGACEAVGLCIESSEQSCGGMQSDSGEPCTFVKEEVHGKCSVGADCDDGIPCVVEDRCADGFLSVCGCSSTSTAPWLASLAGLMMLLFARMR